MKVINWSLIYFICVNLYLSTHVSNNLTFVTLKLWFVNLFCSKSIQCWKLREESLCECHIQIVFNRHEQRLDNLGRSHIVDQENFANIPGVLMRKVVPADNSCLFTSVGYVLNGEQAFVNKKLEHFAIYKK